MIEVTKATALMTFSNEALEDEAACHVEFADWLVLAAWRYYPHDVVRAVIRRRRRAQKRWRAWWFSLSLKERLAYLKEQRRQEKRDRKADRELE